MLRFSSSRRGSNCYLELWEYRSPPSDVDPRELGANDYGIRHLCLDVDDVLAERERLRELRGIQTNPPCCLRMAAAAQSIAGIPLAT